MTEAQRTWLDQHPTFSAVGARPVVSSYGYADEGLLLANGTFIKGGETRVWGGLRVISSDDTLYTDVNGEIRVGRRYDLV